MEQTDFYAEAIIQQNGKIANLIFPRHYPWVVCQAIPVHNQRELDLLSLRFSAKHLPLYFSKDGDRSFFVVQARGCTPGNTVKITQDNCEKVYEDAQKCLQAAADWWSELNKRNK